MTISDLTKPGDKIDVRLFQEQQREQNKGEAAVVYKSSVYDLGNDGTIEIGMPTENGKVVLFQVGMRLNLLFYTSKGMYTCFGRVKDRYKKSAVPLLLIAVETEPEKFQRREFFRIECSLDMQFYRISEETAALETTNELIQAIRRPEFDQEPQRARIMDISGGGIRFVSEECLEPDAYILAAIRLRNPKMDQLFYLVTQIIASGESPNSKDHYVHRCKFIFKDLKDREIIVRYVFEEERKLRKKENG